MNSDMDKEVKECNRTDRPCQEFCKKKLLGVHKLLRNIARLLFIVFSLESLITMEINIRGILHVVLTKPLMSLEVSTPLEPFDSVGGAMISAALALSESP